MAEKIPETEQGRALQARLSPARWARVVAEAETRARIRRGPRPSGQFAADLAGRSMSGPTSLDSCGLCPQSCPDQRPAASSTTWSSCLPYRLATVHQCIRHPSQSVQASAAANRSPRIAGPSGSRRLRPSCARSQARASTCRRRAPTARRTSAPAAENGFSPHSSRAFSVLFAPYAAASKKGTSSAGTSSTASSLPAA